METKLRITNLESGYDGKPILHGVSIEVKEREIITIIGPNGSGKSTVLKTIFGLLKATAGMIAFNGREIQNRNPTLNVREGISFVPQGGRVFTELSVLENLELGGYLVSGKDDIQKRLNSVFEMFPVLGERKLQSAGNLSSGQKQILSLGRALMPNPDLLLLDEPSLGLSSGLVKRTLQKIKEINTKHGVTVLLVEQKVREVLDICNRVYSMKLGKIAFEGPPEVLKQDKAKLKQLFL